MIQPDKRQAKPGEEHLTPTEVMTRKVAIAVAFAGVFFFFIKILFL